MVGQTLGHYRVLEKIGEGGMGVVYRAHDEQLDRDVALKVLPAGTLADEAARKQFRREALALAKLNHPNIETVHDFGSQDGTDFLVMELIPGSSLSVRLKAGPLPEEEIVRLGMQFAEGLAAAHEQGIVHRDLKPGNLMITPDGRLKILDFGLAKLLHPMQEADVTRSVTAGTGAISGTVPYMAPEQLRGELTDARSDIYAAGAVLYEMATGERPFPQTHGPTLMGAILHEAPAPPGSLSKRLTPGLQALILKALEKQPQARYQSAAQLRIAFETIRAGATSARTRMHSVWALPAAGALLVIVLLLGALAGLKVSGWRDRLLGTSRTPATVSGLPSLAEGKYVVVLPFRVSGDQASLGHIGKGIADALSEKLLLLPGIRVASALAAEKTDENQPAGVIAHELGVNLLVRGTLHEAGGKIAVIVNLDDPTAGRHLWTQQFSGAPQDLLALEGDIYTRLAEALGSKPEDIERVRAGTHATENVAAYDLYLRGRDAMRGQEAVEKVETAIRFYNQALEKDSGFALAYAGLADASLTMYEQKKDSFWAEKALAAAQQGRRLNEKLPEVHFALASVYGATGKFEESIAELHRALELAPDSDEGYRRLGGAYLSRSQKDRAIEAYKKAALINPYYWGNQNALGNAYFEIGDFEKALAAFRRVTQLEPENATGYQNIGSVYFRQGNYDACVSMFQKAVNLQPSFPNYSNLGTAYFYLKRYDDAVQMFEKAVELGPNQQWVVGNLADAYRWSGQSEKAKATYDKAIALAYKELQVNPREASVMMNLALYYAKEGDATQALDFIHRARSINRDSLEILYTEGVVKAIVGRPEEALRTMRKAFQKGYPPADAVNDPELKSLRSRPAFEKLVQEFGNKTK